jgi:GT2 family glycosyltransferase
MPKMYILLPVHSRKQITQRIITCLQQQSFQEYHLLLIDDGSTDGTAEMVQERIPSMTILRGQGNWWWGGSLHQGYLWLKSQSLSESTVVLLINDDTTFETSYLETAISILKSKEKALLVSTAYGKQSQKQIDGGVFADWKHWKFHLVTEQSKINCASTRGLFLYASDFIRLGGFYPKMLPHYLSDYEFTVRAFRRGYTLHIDERLKIVVDEKTTGQHDFDFKMPYTAFLNQLFSKKYMMQPFYMTTFVALACPWPWKVTNWILIWSSTGWKIVRYFFLLVIFQWFHKKH